MASAIAFLFFIAAEQAVNKIPKGKGGFPMNNYYIYDSQGCLVDIATKDDLEQKMFKASEDRKENK